MYSKRVPLVHPQNWQPIAYRQTQGSDGGLITILFREPTSKPPFKDPFYLMPEKRFSNADCRLSSMLSFLLDGLGCLRVMSPVPCSSLFW